MSVGEEFFIMVTHVNGYSITPVEDWSVGNWGQALMFKTFKEATEFASHHPNCKLYGYEVFKKGVSIPIPKDTVDNEKVSHNMESTFDSVLGICKVCLESYHKLFNDEFKIILFEIFQKEIHNVVKNKGFHTNNSNEDGLFVANLHSEVSELWEAIRLDNPDSTKAFGFSCVEEELADIILRILDYSELKNYSIMKTMISKMKYNRTRPHKHGGKGC